MSDDTKRPEPPSYEIGYGKPPLQGRFVKGTSGNPKGRPKKAKPPVKSAPIDPSIWEAFLELANREMPTNDGSTMSVRNAIYKSEAATALKGNTHAQKNFLDHDERYRKELAQDIQETNEAYRHYIANY